MKTHRVTVPSILPSVWAVETRQPFSIAPNSKTFIDALALLVLGGMRSGRVAVQFFRLSFLGCESEIVVVGDPI